MIRSETKKIFFECQTLHLYMNIGVFLQEKCPNDV